MDRKEKKKRNVEEYKKETDRILMGDLEAPNIGYSPSDIRKRVVNLLDIEKAHNANKVPEIKKECCVCGTTEDIHKDGAYGYRCSSQDCIVF